MSVLQFTANSLAEFVEQVCNLNNQLVKNGTDRNEISLFRGQSSVDYELMPALGRNQRHFEENGLQRGIFDEERNLIEMAKYKLPDIFRNDMQPLELLALLQHYGIPTRLLDITENALVALYFACCSEPNKDGEVFVFKYNELDVAIYPLGNALADSYRFANTVCEIKDFYLAVTKQPYFIEESSLLSIPINQAVSWIANTCYNRVFCIHAPIRSERQKVQCGRYILFPNTVAFPKGDSSDPKADPLFMPMLTALDKNSDSMILARIRIPKELKEMLLRDLALVGISEDFLFGDDIEKVCAGIKKSFEQKIRPTYQLNNFPRF